MPARVAAWPSAVGDTVGRNAWPARIGRDGTLAVAHQLVYMGVRAQPARADDPRPSRRASSRRSARGLFASSPGGCRSRPASRLRRPSRPPSRWPPKHGAGQKARANDRQRGAPRAGRPGGRAEPLEGVCRPPFLIDSYEPANMQIAGLFSWLKLPTPQRTSLSSKGSSRSGCDRVCTSARRGREACTTSSTRLVDNSVDEALAGRCDEIEVVLHPDNSVTVRDDGSGIPVDIMPEQGLPALTVVLTKLHAGGKFGGEGYKVSGGLHGVGISVVNALSEWLVAEVQRDGKIWRQEFARGEPTDGMNMVAARPRRRGTTISFLPDLEIFDELEWSRDGARAAPPRDGVPDSGPADRRSSTNAPRRAPGRVPLRGRDQGLRRIRQHGRGPAPQARRLLRRRDERGNGRGRDAVERLLRRVRLLLRQQHQHPRGRRASLRVQGRAHRDAEQVRARQGSCSRRRRRTSKERTFARGSPR